MPDQGGFLYVGDYVFGYAYPIAFIGAMFYGIASILNINPADVIANKNLSIALSVIVGASGLISLFNWFGQDVPMVGQTILPNGRNVVKTQQ
jgi:hypothetical protein